MHPRDCLFVYTDSMPEAQKADNEVFGEKRMTEALNQNPGAEPEELLNNIRNAVNIFVRDKPQYDDLTMLSLNILWHAETGKRNR